MADEELARPKERPFKTAFNLLLVVLIYLVALPFLIFSFIKGVFLGFKFRNMAHRQGKFIIFVYSDSPHWKSYIEQNILPQVQEHAIILNWSERSQWDRSSWIVQAFHHWGGQREFNPIAIVYFSLADVRVFRFFKAFHELKRGKSGTLDKVESELVQLVNAESENLKMPPNTASTRRVGVAAFSRVPACAGAAGTPSCTCGRCRAGAAQCRQVFFPGSQAAGTG